MLFSWFLSFKKTIKKDLNVSIRDIFSFLRGFVVIIFFGNRFFLPIFAVLVNKPDRAGGAELAVNFWISALQAVFAQVNIILHANEAGLNLAVAEAFSHFISLEKRLSYIY